MTQDPAGALDPRTADQVAPHLRCDLAKRSSQVH